MADLDELERLEKAATPGPWKWVEKNSIDFGYVGPNGERTVLFGEDHEGAVHQDDPDGKFLAALRNALPELLRRLRAAEADAERYRWLMENATRMSEPLYARGTKASPICGHRVSLIVSFDGDYRSTPWATQETFTAAIDAARKP